MFDHLRDIANAGAEMAALRDERIRLCKEVISKADLTMRIMEITRLRNQYLDIVNWMILDQLAKGYYTEEDKKLGQSCIDEIAQCDKELNRCGQKAVKETVLSKLAEMLLDKNT